MSSKEDSASINIRDQLLLLAEWEKTDTFDDNLVYGHSKLTDVTLVTIDDSHIHLENLYKEINNKLGGYGRCEESWIQKNYKPPNI